ncbi:MerR family transcriptional regulator [Paenibacillus radicis (ex Gao et al. 2016)]|uniref:MerR family transcriptional regulator n=1 Tax=Paenibacillus radicis (ex Gao et al. 2016) TaxID=1737354 RepID=A0A917LUK7_9BACL|nr:MerR family transcriptional regulator [Paenibacillus radicis (ex Gao et al. 2016)]GGG57878.1 MerR family transcriptional regulator [Paenibacillus radicis (ex Gao et al. 2016)]
MSDNDNRYFTTSEMASISGVTKHTLFHYDEIGLLKPEFIHANGYRYYSLRQSYILDIISVLKKAGSTLQEIKGYIENRNGLKLENLFKQKQNDLERELHRIKRMQVIMQNAIQMTKTSMKELRTEPLIEECQEEYLIATPLKQGDRMEINSKLSEHRKYCEKNLINHEFLTWAIVSKETFVSGGFSWSYVANKLKAPIARNRMITKPKGLYVVMDYIGSYESLPEACVMIKMFIERKGMKVCGDVYIMDLLNYFSEIDFDSYAVRISVEVSI